jgi:PPM family protein phosphatase
MVMSEPAVALHGVGLRAAGATDAGRVRHNNEDRLYIDLDRGIFLVVDGVGGHAAGEVAAAVAVDFIVDRLERGGASTQALVRQAIAAANNEIHRLAQRSVEYAGMTCVVTLALVADDYLTVGHVGDSRLYKVDGRGLVKLTRDHSPIGEREDAREISEAEAMRHPRRNEVFRDIGGARRGPNDPEFIDVTTVPFEPDSALLLCSDGLSDMLSSAEIERLIRRHAGNPAVVADALVAAANEAGGRDNVTVVYVEGARFSGVRETSPVPVSKPISPDSVPVSGEPGPRRGRWVALGVVLGLAIAVALLVASDRFLSLTTGRVLVVGPGGYSSIEAAVTAASVADVVQIEPGEYAESIVLDRGVQLTARLPGSVTLVAAPGRPEWTGITARGQGGRISGIEVRGRPGAPMATGIELDGRGLVVDDVTIAGNLDVGMEIREGAEALVRASRFSDVRGLAVRVGPSANPTLRQNVFRRGADEHGPALLVQDGATPTVDANVFQGYLDPIGAPAARRQQLLLGNYFIRGSSDASR